MVLWISRLCIEYLIHEASSRFPLETGGVLAGYFAVDGSPVITKAVGPGPQAQHRRLSFSPDQDFQVHELEAIYRESGGTERYLGDWHSHPEGHLNLSRKDLKCLGTISSNKDSFLDKPIMIVVAGGKERPWQLGAWTYKKFFIFHEAEQMRLQEFNN